MASFVSSRRRKPSVLQPLRAGEQLRIDLAGPDCSPDRPHRLAHGFEESGAGILHQVPAVGDLHSFRQGFRRRFSIAAATVACHDLDAGMIGQPRLHSRNLPVRQECHDPAPFQVAYDAAIAVVAAESPIVNADHAERIARRTGTSPDDPQQRVVADRHHQPLGKIRRWPAAERQSEMVDNAFQAGCPAAPLGHGVVLEPLGENAPPAEWCVTEETACDQMELHLSARTGQIRNASRMPAVQAA